MVLALRIRPRLSFSIQWKKLYRTSIRNDLSVSSGSLPVEQQYLFAPSDSRLCVFESEGYILPFPKLLYPPLELLARRGVDLLCMGGIVVILNDLPVSSRCYLVVPSGRCVSALDIVPGFALHCRNLRVVSESSGADLAEAGGDLVNGVANVRRRLNTRSAMASGRLSFYTTAPLQ